MVLMLDVDQTAALQEARAVIRMGDDVTHVFGIPIKLLPQVIVLLDGGLIFNLHVGLFNLEVVQNCRQVSGNYQ